MNTYNGAPDQTQGEQANGPGPAPEKEPAGSTAETPTAAAAPGRAGEAEAAGVIEASVAVTTAGASVAADHEHSSGATADPLQNGSSRITRGVARPEGGGRAASGDAPAPARQWPMLAVLCTAGLGLLITAFDVFRIGTIIVGLALVGGAVLRRLVPSVGMLAVRSRFTDMVTYGGLGMTIVLLAMMAEPSPWLSIPFLGDTLHFTIK